MPLKTIKKSFRKTPKLMISKSKDTTCYHYFPSPFLLLYSPNNYNIQGGKQSMCRVLGITRTCYVLEHGAALGVCLSPSSTLLPSLLKARIPWTTAKRPGCSDPVFLLLPFISSSGQHLLAACYAVSCQIYTRKKRDRKDTNSTW